MRILLFTLLTFGLITACSQSETKNQNTGEQTLEQRVENYMSASNFEAALAAVKEASPANADELNEKIHLQHGIYLIYNSDPSQMRENANNALREFIAVLEINPENEKAIAETEQILGIYRSFPDRKPADDVVKKLKELGFEI